MWQVCEGDHLPSSRAEVKNDGAVPPLRSYIFIAQGQLCLHLPPQVLVLQSLSNHTFPFTPQVCRLKYLLAHICSTWMYTQGKLSLSYTTAVASKTTFVVSGLLSWYYLSFFHKERKCLRFEVFTAVTVKNSIFWDVMPCDLVRTDVSEELSASFIRVTRIGEQGTTLTVTSNRRTLQRNTSLQRALVASYSHCHPDGGGAKFLRNVSFYKNHTA
jgi:hypothetical protein